MEIVHLPWDLFWNPCWHLSLESNAKPGVSALENILDFLHCLFTPTCFLRVGEQVYKKGLCIEARASGISALVHSNGNTGIIANFEIHDIEVEAAGCNKAAPVAVLSDVGSRGTK
jgi:hypothetical protein